MKRRMRFVAAGLLVAGVFGCARTSGQPLLIESGSKPPIFYVERHSKDGRNLAGTIAEELRARGLRATSGSFEERPDEFDLLVTYEDRWQWDIRMYLMDLRIDIRDPETSHVLGFGESYQPSLPAMGKTHRDIVKRALNEILSPAH